MDKNSYLSIACDDIKHYVFSMKGKDRWPSIIYLGQQAVEKMLKGLLKEVFDEDKDSNSFRTHSIKALLSKLEEYINLDNYYTNIILADGYYFDIRYPGDNFFTPSERDYNNMYVAVKSTLKLVQEAIGAKPLLYSIYAMDSDSIINLTIDE